ncbi:hypothetical protein SELMODRAFT_126088, partial [Selaginella moellendorffii]
GNRMNVGTFRGDAQAFKLNSLLKLSDVKSVDGKTSLLHFIVQEVVRAENAQARKSPTAQSPARTSSFMLDNKQVELDKAGRQDMQDDLKQIGTQVILGINAELENVRKADGQDFDTLKNSVFKLVTGLQSLEKSLAALRGTAPSSREKGEEEEEEDVFLDVMTKFMSRSVSSVERVKQEYDTVLVAVKKLNVYFDGDAKKDDATAFQIFHIVSQFIMMLERACADTFGKKK